MLPHPNPNSPPVYVGQLSVSARVSEIGDVYHPRAAPSDGSAPSELPPVSGAGGYPVQVKAEPQGAEPPQPDALFEEKQTPKEQVRGRPSEIGDGDGGCRTGERWCSDGRMVEVSKRAASPRRTGHVLSFL